MNPRRSRRRDKRQYHRSGQHTLRRALPELLARVRDPDLADAELSPIERAARAWRHDVVADLGGAAAMPATKAALLDAIVGTKILLDSIDRYVIELAAQDGLVSRRYRSAFRIVSDRMRVADGLAKQLQALGLAAAAPAPPDLAVYLARRPRSRQRAQAPPGALLTSGSSPVVASAAGAPQSGAEATTDAT
jgi:hypothetical protein